MVNAAAQCILFLPGAFPRQSVKSDNRRIDEVLQCGKLSQVKDEHHPAGRGANNPARLPHEAGVCDWPVHRLI